MVKWTEQESNTAKELLQTGSTYDEISKVLNKTKKSVKLRLNRLGLTYKEFNKKERIIRICECCGGQIKNAGIRFCSSSCAAKINNSLYPKRTPIDIEQSKIKRKRIRFLKKIEKCISCGENCYKKYCNFSCQQTYQNKLAISNWKAGIDLGYSGKTKQLKPFIRRYLIGKFDNKCSKCGWCEIHPITGKVPIEVNHIDGDAENCKEENLEVICPNCHALTHNFRALNKNSKRDR